MSRTNLLASGLLLLAISACARRPASAPVGPAADATAARVSYLAAEVATSRARLDSALLEVHRRSGDTATSSLARSRQSRTAAMSLDSAHRANLAELLWTVNASTSGNITDNARFPVEAAPTPLIRGFTDGENWMMQSPMIHEIGKNSPYVVIVPRGFVTDLASIPQPLQILRGRRTNTDRYVTAAIVHDYLYWRQDCTRAQADNIMAIALMESGMSSLERTLVIEGVRRFGQSAWDGNRRARQTGLIRTVAPPHDLVPPTGTWAEYREWLRTTRAKEGFEYRVQESVCAIADSVRIPG